MTCPMACLLLQPVAQVRNPRSGSSRSARCSRVDAVRILAPRAPARLSFSTQPSGRSGGLRRAGTFCAADAAVLPLFPDEDHSSRDEDDQAQPIGDKRQPRPVEVTEEKLRRGEDKCCSDEVPDRGLRRSGAVGHVPSRGCWSFVRLVGPWRAGGVPLATGTGRTPPTRGPRRITSNSRQDPDHFCRSWLGPVSGAVPRSVEPRRR